MSTTKWPLNERCKNNSTRLQAIRNQLGLTQDAMASRLQQLGVRCSRATVAKLECGAGELTLPVAIAYAASIGITVEQLISPEPITFTVSI